MKPREQRQKVMIKARMRLGATWHDVCILNVSNRGLGIQAARPPGRGDYVEIRRGQQIVIGRIVWSKGHRAGLRSQDPVFIHGLVNDTPAAAAQSHVPKGGMVERRLSPRPAAEAHERSRLAGRALEFACFALVACALGVTALGAVSEALARPMSIVEAALD